jgi:heterokaryon incompatibility protein (HET)
MAESNTITLPGDVRKSIYGNKESKRVRSASPAIRVPIKKFKKAPTSSALGTNIVNDEYESKPSNSYLRRRNSLSAPERRGVRTQQLCFNTNDDGLAPTDAKLDHQMIEELKAASTWLKEMNDSDIGWIYSDGSELVSLRPWPWIRSRRYRDTMSTEQLLCRRCSLLDLEFFFSRLLSSICLRDRQGNELKISTPRYINLGPLFKIKGNLQCKFCNIIWNSILYQEHERNGALSKTAAGLEGDILNSICMLGNTRLNTQGGPICLYVGFGPEIIADVLRRHWITTIICHLNTSTVPKREVVSPFIQDPSLIRSWIQTCENEHQRSCILQKAPEVLRVIDVLHHCLADIRPNTKSMEPEELQSQYVALSYVWGNSATIKLGLGNMADFYSPGSLSLHSATIPQTIRDAMSICAKLGERYLWVDSLCIVQDGGEVQLDISKMHQIFGGAKLTIAAMSGISADSGLTGVSKPRLGQFIAYVQGKLIANGLSQGIFNNGRSAWNT